MSTELKKRDLGVTAKQVDRNEAVRACVTMIPGVEPRERISGERLLSAKCCCRLGRVCFAKCCVDVERL